MSHPPPWSWPTCRNILDVYSVRTSNTTRSTRDSCCRMHRSRWDNRHGCLCAGFFFQRPWRTWLRVLSQKYPGAQNSEGRVDRLCQKVLGGSWRESRIRVSYVMDWDLWCVGAYINNVLALVPLYCMRAITAWHLLNSNGINISGRARHLKRLFGIFL